MNVLFIFFIGLTAGLLINVMRPVQPDDKRNPTADMVFGMMGALLIGGSVAQFIHTTAILVIASIIGAIVFIEMGRTMPEPD